MFLLLCILPSADPATSATSRALAALAAASTASSDCTLAALPAAAPLLLIAFSLAFLSLEAAKAPGDGPLFLATVDDDWLDKNNVEGDDEAADLLDLAAPTAGDAGGGTTAATLVLYDELNK